MDQTWKPTAAGVLSIISGCIEIWWGVMATFFGGLIGSLGLGGWSEMWEPWMGEMSPMFPDIMGIISTAALIIGIVLIVFGIIALVGGVYAIRRKRWGLALAGAILSFPFIPLGGILGLLAIIFVSLGKGEFE
jgi:hypothetical protein